VLGAGFLRALQFPCQFLFHRLLHVHHITFGAGTIGQLVTDIPSGFSVIAPQGINKKTL
jgi:hypothetical protein